MTWQLTGVSNKTDQTKCGTLTSHSPHAPLITSHVPHLSEWHHRPQAPKLAVNPGSVPPCISSQDVSRIQPILSILAAPASAQTLTISSLNQYTRNLPTASWLSFSPAPTPPQRCCQSNLSKTKSDYVTSLFRIFVFGIKCKILPRTYKVLCYPASNYLPCFIWGRGPHISHESNRATWKFPNSASLSAQDAILSVAHLANSHSFFLCPAQNSQFIMLFSGRPSHFASLPIITLIQPDTIICLYVCLPHKTRNPLGFCILLISVFYLLNERMSQDLNKNIQTPPDKCPLCESKQGYRPNLTSKSIFKLTTLTHQKFFLRL